MPEIAFVLDACALLAFLNKEDGWELVRDLLIQASFSAKTRVYMSAINLIEVYYDRLRNDNAAVVEKFIRIAFDSPIIIVDRLSRAEIDESARLKALYPISLADAIGISIAKTRSAFFVTCDHHELDKLDGQIGVHFYWIRAKQEKE